MLDPTVMADIAKNHFLPVVINQFGHEGSKPLRDILEFLKAALFKRINADVQTGKVIVFKAVGQAQPLSLKGSVTLTDIAYLSQEQGGAFTLQLLDNGLLRLWKHATVDINNLSKRAIVYVYHDRSDRFVAKGKVGTIPNPDPQHASVFAIPTFDSLKEALMYYRAKRATNSACKILTQAWFEEARLFLKTAPRKPEEIMRDSLSEFLASHLRGDRDVHPEHNVNASEPVDIRVQWLFSNFQALIEIKWMGKSKNASGKITNRHGAARARAGAKRLAEYLEEEKKQTPMNLQRGYLVVIDARRWKVKASATTVDARKGLHYKTEEITFNPKYHLLRSDFEEPLRMFIAPRLDV